VSPPRLQLDFEHAWKLEPVASAVRFLGALAALELEQATLYLEGTTDRQVEEFLTSRSVEPGIPIERATIWPKTDLHHLAVSTKNLEDLSRLLGLPEIDHLAHHVHIYTAIGVVVQWHDAFGRTPIYVAGDVEEDKIRQFATSLGVRYERETAS